jgi:hypothetical protein
MTEDIRHEIIEKLKECILSFDKELIHMETTPYTGMSNLQNAVLYFARQKNKEFNNFITERGYEQGLCDMFSRYIKNERLKNATDELSKFILKWL